MTLSPFGESVTFWALEEIARGYLGALGDEDEAAVRRSLDAVLPVGPDREWIRQRLHALLGWEAAPASRDENFAAWSRFLEDRAATAPSVLVLEDLHWADEALLGFLEHLATHLGDVPMFILATTRPELFEAHEGLTAAAGVDRIELEPLPAAQMRSLVISLVGDDPADEGSRQTIVGRAEGNPFFAEESARLLADRAGAIEQSPPVSKAESAVDGSTNAAARRRTGGAGRTPGRPSPRAQAGVVRCRCGRRPVQHADDRSHQRPQPR